MSRKIMGNEKFFSNRGWASVYSEGWKFLFDHKITGEQIRVFSFLMHRIGYENWVHAQQKDIAEALGIDKKNVSLAIRQLVDADLIARAGSSLYMVNPRFACKGKRGRKMFAIYEQQKIKGEDDGAFGSEAGVDCE